MGPLKVTQHSNPPEEHLNAVRTQHHRRGHRLTQTLYKNSIHNVSRAPEHLFQVPGQAGSKAQAQAGGRGARRSRLAHSTHAVGRCHKAGQCSANREDGGGLAAAVTATSSTEMKPPARRGWTFFLQQGAAGPGRCLTIFTQLNLPCCSARPSQAAHVLTFLLHSMSTRL